MLILTSRREITYHSAITVAVGECSQPLTEVPVDPTWSSWVGQTPDFIARGSFGGTMSQLLVLRVLLMAGLLITGLDWNGIVSRNELRHAKITSGTAWYFIWNSMHYAQTSIIASGTLRAGLHVVTP